MKDGSIGTTSKLKVGNRSRLKVGFAILVISLAVEIVFDARVAKESADTRLEAAKIEAANLELEKRMHGFVHKHGGLGEVR